MPFHVRLRPNAAYLALLGIGVAAILAGFTFSGVSRILLMVCGAGFLVVVGAPVLASTIMRVPILTVDATGIRLPMTGVRLGWADLGAVRQSSSPTRVALLIVPKDKQATLEQMRPWLRAEGRSNIAHHGTPLVMSKHSLDHSLEDIQSAITRFRPAL